MLAQKTTSQSRKRLRAAGLSDAAIAKLGGRCSKGGNCTFVEGDAGFAQVCAMFGVTFPDPKRDDESVKEWLRENGPKLWDAWHRGLLIVELTERAIDDFTQRTIIDPLPRGSCTCRSHLAKIMRQHTKPASMSRRAVCDWGYIIHDKVNVKTWKVPIGIERARAIYERGATSSVVSRAG